MPGVTREQIAQAKQIDLLSYLQRYEPNAIVKSGSDYRLKEHDSLVISENGKWNWFSRGFGGKTALDFLIHVRGQQVYWMLFKCSWPAAPLLPFLPSRFPRRTKNRFPFPPPIAAGFKPSRICEGAESTRILSCAVRMRAVSMRAGNTTRARNITTACLSAMILTISLALPVCAASQADFGGT